MRNTDVLLVGSVPARNSARLFWPSPSGSAAPSACGQLVHPKYCNCQHGNASVCETVALPVIDEVQPVVPSVATTVYVPTPVWLPKDSAAPVPATGEPVSTALI